MTPANYGHWRTLPAVRNRKGTPIMSDFLHSARARRRRIDPRALVLTALAVGSACSASHGSSNRDLTPSEAVGVGVQALTATCTVTNATAQTCACAGAGATCSLPIEGVNGTSLDQIAISA